MIYIRKIIFYSILFFSYQYVSSISPERYDHLWEYKQNKVTKTGPSQEIVYRNNILIETAKYSYNKTKQLIMTRYFSDDVMSGYTKYYYNTNGLYKELTYNNKNKLVEKNQYQRNNKGYIIKSKIQDILSGTDVIWKFQYKYPNFWATKGKQYINNKLSEYYISKKSNNTIVQTVYNDKSERIITINNVYNQNKQVIRKQKKSEFLNQIVKYNYSNNKLLLLIQFYEITKDKGKSLAKKHIFKY